MAGVPVNNSTPADVINLSLSGDGPCSLAEQSAINAAVAAGSVVVVSAGNDDGTNVADISPANCENVIVAGAIARDGSLASYANVGLAVDVTAPGGDGPNPESNILTLYNSGTTVAATDELSLCQWYQFYVGPGVGGCLTDDFAECGVDALCTGGCHKGNNPVFP